MPVTRFVVENYRSFADPTEVSLRPLTLVFGRNSAGKSALVRVLPLLAEAARSSTTDPIVLGTPLTRKASFEDIRSRLTSHPWMRFTLDLASDAGTVGFTFTVSDRLDANSQVLEAFSITAGPRHLAATWDLAQTQHVRHELSWIDTGTGDHDTTNCQLNPFFRPHSLPRLDWHADALDQCAALRRALDRLGDHVHHLGATRTSPDREFERAPNRLLRLAYDGADALPRLAHADAAARDEETALSRRVQVWCQQHLGHHLRLQAISSTRLYRAKVCPRDGNVEIDLCDTGEGLGQVLPVLVALAEVERRATQSPQLLVLEQPELHLHLDAQHTLMQMFCEVASGQSPPTLLVETHSESMLVALQRAIVEGRLTTDKVLVYVVRQDARGYSYADRVTFDDDGYPSAAWPTEMFKEVVQSARALDALRWKRARP